jgi:integrase
MKTENEILSIMSGTLGKSILEYINYKRALGKKVGIQQIYELRNLYLFLKSKSDSGTLITREMYEEWTSVKEGEKETTTLRRRVIMTGFAKYLVSIGYTGIYTGDDDVRSFKSDFTPYIYTEKEITDIFEAIDRLCMEKPTYMNHAFQMMMQMYYCCGFRKNEVTNLKVRDVDFNTGKISVWNSKNNVSRVVVASESLLLKLRQYKTAFLCNADKDDYLFHGTCKNYYDTQAIYRRFHKILDDAGISRMADGTRPRLHDFRHTFCVRTLERMPEKGFDLYTSLPLLSKYLGHSHITATEYYLRMVENHYKEILEKTQTYYPELYGKEDAADEQ